jgi:hypothetical protein
MLRVSQQVDDVVALLPMASACQPGRFLRLLLPVANLWSTRAAALDCLDWIDRGVAIATESHQEACVAVLRLHATLICLDAREIAKAQRYASQLSELDAKGLDPDMAAWCFAARAAALGASSQVKEAFALLEGWLAQRPARSPGYWTVLAALGRLGLPSEHLPAAPMELVSSMRDQLTGSRTWCDLLLALCESSQQAEAPLRLQLAKELLQSAQALRSLRRAEYALARIAWAELAMDDITAANTTVYEWYRMSRAAGRTVPAAIACQWLAEAAWRSGETMTAQRWLGDAKQLLRNEPLHSLHQSMAAHTIAIHVTDGELGAASRSFLELGTDVINGCQTYPLLELLAEAGGMLAYAHGLGPLAQSITDALVLIGHPSNKVPAVERSRQLRLPPPSAALPERSADTVERFSRLVRAQLTTLHDHFRVASRTIAISPAAN